VLLAGGWILFANLARLRAGSPLAFLASEHGIRAARILFAVSLIPIGLSHFVYVKETAELVPAWLPYRFGWAYLTGAGQIACGLGVCSRSCHPSPRGRKRACSPCLPFSFGDWHFSPPRERACRGPRSSSHGRSPLPPGS
jgi:hypothetical protein